MERDLYKFYDNVEIISKDFSTYEDEKGNYFTFNSYIFSNYLNRIRNYA